MRLPLTDAVLSRLHETARTLAGIERLLREADQEALLSHLDLARLLVQVDDLAVGFEGLADKLAECVGPAVFPLPKG